MTIVMGITTLMIRHFKYLLAIIFALLNLFPLAHATDECPFTSKSPDNEILVGWITNQRTTGQFISGSNVVNTTSVGEFRILAAIKNKKIIETSGTSIHDGQKFWPVVSSGNPVHLSSAKSFLDRMGKDHCVYFASIKHNEYPTWTLFTSAPDKRFRIPNKADLKLFYSLNKTCVNQGDYPEDKKATLYKTKVISDQ